MNFGYSFVKHPMLYSRIFRVINITVSVIGHIFGFITVIVLIVSRKWYFENFRILLYREY